MEENIIDRIVEIAKQSKKKIVLPEGEDSRVIEATSILLNKDICDVILIGNSENIKNKANDLNVNINGAKIIEVAKSEKYEQYVNAFYELRKNKGITMEDAKKIVLDNVYFATMMVKQGDADGLVSGACHSTSDTLRPALQIIKQKQGINTVSSFFLMETKKRELGANGIFIFSDCGLIESPTPEQFADISNSSVSTFRLFSKMEPKVALLSYSTLGSAKGELIDKTRLALEKIKQTLPDYEVDGEMQLDSAIIPEVAKLKAKDSNVAGKANILLFPNLEAGNIGYKLAQRFGDMIALGPITQGIAKPVNDLSRGCNSQDIVGVVAITCVQAENNN